MQLTLAVSYSEANILSKLNLAQREDKYYRGGPLDPQLLSRYSYARNNPLKFNDSSGHWIWAVAGGIIGAAVGLGAYALTHQDNFQWGEAAYWAGGGALVGVTLGAAAAYVAPWAQAVITTTIVAAASSPTGQVTIQWLSNHNNIYHLLRPGHAWDRLVSLSGELLTDYQSVQPLIEQTVQNGEKLIKESCELGQLVTYVYNINGETVIVNGIEIADDLFKLVDAFVKTQ